MTPTYSTVRYGEIDVCWTADLDGGGMGFGQDYVPIVEDLFGHVGRLCEVCAGPGFIGFAMLAHGLCDSLVLTDINPDAVAAARETVRRNGLERLVTVYLSDGLDDLPADEQYDLFVSNPPHFASPVGASVNSLLTDDLDWDLHRRFFADVGRFLAPGGSVLWQKNSHGATPEEMLPMIESGGLRHVDTMWYRAANNATLFYLWVKALSPDLISDKGRSEPVWVDLEDSVRVVHELTGQTSHLLQLHNRTRRPITFRFADVEGREPLGGRARDLLSMKLSVDGKLALPRMGLRAGEYFIFDDQSDSALAHLRVLE